MHEDDRDVAEACRLLGEARGQVERAAGLLTRAGLDVAGASGQRMVGYIDGLIAHIVAVEAEHQRGMTVARAGSDQ